MKEFIINGVTKRFFEALDLLIGIGAIRGINTFCDEHNIDRRNLTRTQKDSSTRIQLVWIYYLCTDFNISADWIITGRGPKFRDLNK